MAIRAYFVIVLVSMIVLTALAASQAGFWSSAAALAADPWGRLTLADAYFAIVTVYLLTAFREPSPWAKLVWLGLFLSLGSLAIASYGLVRSPRRDRSLMSPEAS